MRANGMAILALQTAIAGLVAESFLSFLPP
jgi:hypothetical protein